MAKILILGTGSFAARIIFDIAATATTPIDVVIAGRNVARLDWLRTAANARAAIFQTDAQFSKHRLDMTDPDAIGETITNAAPTVIVQAASPQASSVIAARGNAWTQLIAQAGLSAMAVTQTMFPIRVARAVKASGLDCHVINCSYPDVGNTLLAALDLPVTCGVGNVAILSSVFADPLEAREPGRLKVLAHYQTITPYRHPAAERRGPEPRLWLDNREIENVRMVTRAVKLTPEPVIEISGASGVPLMLAMANGTDWQGHVPAPHGQPGGYPVALSGGSLTLALPAGLGEGEAVSWNAQFEQANGLHVDAEGRARYAGVLHEKLSAVSPDLAAGFDVKDFDDVFAAMETLRARLIEMPEAR